MKGFKTLVFNLLAVMMPILQASGAADLGLEGTNAMIYAAILAMVNIILRFFTTTPVGTK